jgi:hypothetical protein
MIEDSSVRELAEKLSESRVASSSMWINLTQYLSTMSLNCYGSRFLPYIDRITITKGACIEKDHRPRNISLVSATRLSPRDPWLSVSRLLVVWLYRRCTWLLFLPILKTISTSKERGFYKILILKQLFGFQDYPVPIGVEV